MGDAFYELVFTLRSSKDKVTPQEEHVLQTCWAKAIRDLTFGACVASGLMWTATRRLGYRYRVTLLGGAAFLCGTWRYNRSLNSCLDQILAWEGSRMQRELANLILTKHKDDPRRRQLVNKHFYSEMVFDDSNLDQPLSRWRPRHLFGDGIYRTQDSSSSSSIEKPNLEPQQLTRIPVEDDIADPLDCILGYSGGVAIPLETIAVPAREHSHNRKRERRRHRVHRSELSAYHTSPQNT